MGANEEPDSGIEFDLIKECWQLAGYVGVIPHDLTYRELHTMFIGRERITWIHTANMASASSGVAPIQYVPRRYRPETGSAVHDTTHSGIGWKLLFKGILGGMPPD